MIRTMKTVAVAAILSMCFTSPIAHAAAPGLLVGAGEGTGGSFCTPHATVSLVGLGDAQAWTIHFLLLRVDGGCAQGTRWVFQGPWRPSEGGCIAGTLPSDPQLCLAPVPPGISTVAWAICQRGTPDCLPAQTVAHGTATVVRM